jgi:uncharacterized OsmC-like protein
MAKLTAKAKLLENVKLVTENDRGQSVICDLPEDAGGTNSGPTPLELGMMSLAACGVIIFANVCKNSKIDPGKVEVNVEAEKPANSPIIKNVSMKVNVTSKTRKSLLEAAWRRTEANCPMVFVFRENIPVKVDFESKEE